MRILLPSDRESVYVSVDYVVVVRGDELIVSRVDGTVSVFPLEGLYKQVVDRCIEQGMWRDIEGAPAVSMAIRLCDPKDMYRILKG